MNPIFTVPYSEYSVAEKLREELHCSVFLPMSAQEKGIDLLLYRDNGGAAKVVTVQVKMSRSYMEKDKKSERYQWNSLWFNRFEAQSNAEWFILMGLYPDLPNETQEEYNTETSENGRKKAFGVKWENVFLAFIYEEMKEFLEGVRQKKDVSKADRMFGFCFSKVNGEMEIYQTRGYHHGGVHCRDMRGYLLENRIEEMRKGLQ
jgi:hypothetical protein